MKFLSLFFVILGVGSVVKADCMPSNLTCSLPAVDGGTKTYSSAFIEDNSYDTNGSPNECHARVVVESNDNQSLTLFIDAKQDLRVFVQTAVLDASVPTYRFNPDFVVYNAELGVAKTSNMRGFSPTCTVK